METSRLARVKPATRTRPTTKAVRFLILNTILGVLRRCWFGSCQAGEIHPESTEWLDQSLCGAPQTRPIHFNDRLPPFLLLVFYTPFTLRPYIMQSPYVAMGRQLLRSATRQRSCSSQPLHCSISTARHELLEPSPFIRSLGPRPISAPSSTDFVIYPNFLDLEEQDVLIKLALWKLDRADSRKKRRRRRRAGDEAGDDESARAGGLSVHDQLQSIFESEAEYGFEEVS